MKNYSVNEILDDDLIFSDFLKNPTSLTIDINYLISALNVEICKRFVDNIDHNYYDEQLMNKFFLINHNAFSSNIFNIFYNPIYRYIQLIQTLDIDDYENKKKFFNDYIQRFNEEIVCSEQNTYDYLYDYYINLYNLILSDEYVNNNELEEFSILLLHFNNEKVEEDKAINAIFRRILECNSCVDSWIYSGLLLLFSKQVINQYDSSISLVMTKNIEDNVKGYYDMGANCIVLNTNYISPFSLPTNLLTIIHEIKHKCQKMFFDENTRLGRLLLKDSAMENTFGEDFVNKNYWNLTEEVNARIESLIELQKYLRRIAPNYQFSIDDEFDSTIKAKRPNGRYIYGKDFFIGGSIDEIFDIIYQKGKINIELLAEEFHISKEKLETSLNMEYDNVHSRRSIIDLLLNKYECNPDENKRREFYDMIIYETELSLDYLKKSIDELRNFNSDNPLIMQEIIERLLPDYELKYKKRILLSSTIVTGNTEGDIYGKSI